MRKLTIDYSLVTFYDHSLVDPSKVEVRKSKDRHFEKRDNRQSTFDYLLSEALSLALTCYLLRSLVDPSKVIVRKSKYGRFEIGILRMN